MPPPSDKCQILLPQSFLLDAPMKMNVHFGVGGSFLVTIGSLVMGLIPRVFEAADAKRKSL